MKKVVIVSGIQIINNPRVVKEATALSNAGYEVEVLGAIYDAESNERIQRILKTVSWKHTPVIDLSRNSLLGNFDYLLARLRRKTSFSIKKALNIESPNQLGYYVNRLYKIAKNRKADLYIVHLEQALWVGKELLKLGRKVAIDVEDWYSEDCLPEDQKMRPLKLMKECESDLLKNAVYSTTTSKSLSNALERAYQCPKPTVVYNSFSLAERECIDGKILDRRDITIPSIVWFSQTIGPGRGLENLILALNKIHLPFELHIRGSDRRNYREELLRIANKSISNRIFFHPQVPQEELLSRLSEHDIGYCGDLSNCSSRDLTITNKMMEYLRAGLAIIASDTEGHKEIAEKVTGAVRIFEQKNMDSLIKELQTLLNQSDTLALSKQKSKVALDIELNWESSSKLLVDLVKNSLVK